MPEPCREREKAKCSSRRRRTCDAPRGAANTALMETGTGGPASDHPWHAIPVEEATRTIQSDAATGLSTAEATQRIGRFGENLLPEPERRSTWMVLLGQFKSPLIYLLLLAAGVALALGHTSDAAVIAAVVVLNALIGALQEGRAERALV